VRINTPSGKPPWRRRFRSRRRPSGRRPGRARRVSRLRKPRTKKRSKLSAKDSGTDEGYIADYYLGSIAADQGKLSDAEKRFSEVADSAGKRYASLAKLALGQLYFAEGKPDLGEKTLRALMANPTVFVSKDQAAITLAKMLAPIKPDEARKLLDPLRARPGAVSEAAIQAYGNLPPQ